MRTLFFILTLVTCHFAVAQPASYVEDALTSGNDSLITRLCTEGTTVQAQLFGRKLQSALHVAASAHQGSTIKVLVSECGMDPSGLDVTNTPPLYYARMSPETVATLLEQGANPNQIIKHQSLPVISQFLVNIVPRESLEAFLNHDVDLTQKDVAGMTPLMYAVRAKRIENIEFLMDARDQGHDIASDELYNGRKISEIAISYIAALLAEYGIE